VQPASAKCSYLEELRCKEDSLNQNWYCFNQNQDIKGNLKKMYLILGPWRVNLFNNLDKLKHVNIVYRLLLKRANE